MKEDAYNAPSPLWVRLVRMVVCIIFALFIGWRGAEYDPPYASAAVPFAMCQLMAALLTIVGVTHVVRSGEVGPA